MKEALGDTFRGRHDSPAASFPELEARSLTGQRYRLPGDFEGERNAVLVGFEWWQQAVMDSWVPTLEALASRHPVLRVYEVVPIPHASLPARPVIDGGMARGIQSQKVRARTLTSYTDLPRVLAALGLSDTSDAVLLLLDRGGSVLWWTRGGYDPERAETLAHALAPRIGDDGPAEPAAAALKEERRA